MFQGSLAFALTLAAAAWLPEPVAAQSRQSQAQWRSTDTQRFEIHYVPALERELDRVVRSAERAFDRIGGRLNFALGAKAPLVIFAPSGLLSVVATQGSDSNSGRLRVFTTRAIATVLAKIGRDFERRTGRTLDITTDVAIRMVRRIDAGEPFDLLVAAPTQIDALIRAGKIIPETRTDLARSGIGVAVRAGAPKPDVNSVDAFTRALIAARSIAYLKEGQSGVYVARLLERLGIADTIRSKLTLPETDIVSELVSQGQVELGIVVITQILTTDGVALAGPLPSEIQSYVTFTGGISASSQSIGHAKELLDVLQSPAAITVMRAQGMEPGK